MSKVSKMVLNMNNWSKAMYVRDIGDGSNYIVYVMLFMSEMSKIYKHVFAHNFLNIQWIFNPEKVLKSWDIGLCILKHVGDVGDRSSTPKGYNAIYVKDIGFDGMAEKP